MGQGDGYCSINSPLCPWSQCASHGYFLFWTCYCIGLGLALDYLPLEVVAIRAWLVASILLDRGSVLSASRPIMALVSRRPVTTFSVCLLFLQQTCCSFC